MFVSRLVSGVRLDRCHRFVSAIDCWLLRTCLSSRLRLVRCDELVSQRSLVSTVAISTIVGVFNCSCSWLPFSAIEVPRPPLLLPDRWELVFFFFFLQEMRAAGNDQVVTDEVLQNQRRVVLGL